MLPNFQLNSLIANMTLKEITDIAQNVSIILASFFAIYGIDAWRREHVGIRRIELAEEVLALFYQARDAIESIRSPFGFSGEGQSRKPSENESDEEKQALDQAYVLIERYNKHSELFSRIYSLRYKFMALLGQEAAQPFDELNKIVNELILSSHQMARRAKQPMRHFSSEAQEKKDWEYYLKIDRVYYSGGDGDPIAPRVDQTILDIEKTCHKIIESKGTLFSIINAQLPRFSTKKSKSD